jgi:hypothetical protein
MPHLCPYIFLLLVRPFLTRSTLFVTCTAPLFARHYAQNNEYRIEMK